MMNLQRLYGGNRFQEIRLVRLEAGFACFRSHLLQAEGVDFSVYRADVNHAIRHGR